MNQTKKKNQSDSVMFQSPMRNKLAQDSKNEWIKLNRVAAKIAKTMSLESMRPKGKLDIFRYTKRLADLGSRQTCSKELLLRADQLQENLFLVGILLRGRVLSRMLNAQKSSPEKSLEYQKEPDYRRLGILKHKRK